ncbi:MAG: DUF2948 family protein [Hyphomicrobiales bacterium]|nr:DUF2948 family protein [Hyphomicrobiales bacterium]
MDQLRLVALDSEDLDVLSAHLQDAVLKIGDLSWLKNERRFVLAVNRFVWETADSGRRKTYERRRTALHFDRVRGARAKNLRQGAKDAVVELLAVRFTETDAPSGEVQLVFAGGGELVLDVECLEAQMADLGPAWETGARPEHQTDD